MICILSNALMRPYAVDTAVAPRESDPRSLESIAITATDLVAAVEARRTADRDVVLRITPPFSGRMRARLHDAGIAGSSADEPSPLYVTPGSLLASCAPPYPRPDATETALRADPDREYSIDAHRQRYRDAIERWRKTLPEFVREETTLQTAEGPVSVRVHVLG